MGFYTVWSAILNLKGVGWGSLSPNRTLSSSVIKLTPDSPSSSTLSNVPVPIYTMSTGNSRCTSMARLGMVSVFPTGLVLEVVVEVRS